MELRSADFADFFRAIHGPEPFPWQQELVDRLAKCDEWPDVLDLPTGAGKTVAMDAAVFHLALRADTPERAALRVVFVVDRRLVVDDAFGRAEKIATVLRRALCADVDEHRAVREVARRLRRLAGEDAPPLSARRLRGGAPLERVWARTPTQPTILCSTVDQVGSRLLFRGYGVSDRMKPVHAGLLGAHCLLLLDEAHLSEPFRKTLAAVQHLGRARIRTAILSATPGGKAERPLELSLADRAHPVLKRRIGASKPVTLDTVRGALPAVAEAFAKAARAIADRLQAQGTSAPAIGIVVNRVALARGIFETLRGDEVFDAVLMIGRSRSVDRHGIEEELAPFRTGANTRSKARPLFVVATQCLEVGVDLDLDGLVTQAAPLDALRQRFGRLNRAGRDISAEGAILACTEDVAKKADDPVYGDRIRLTWEALQSLAEDDTLDFGVEALPERLEGAGIDRDGLATKRPNAPVVMPAYLELWSQTSPRPAADPDIGLFLHGIERTLAGVSIVWRGDISDRDLNEASLDELFRLVPPRASEAVEVPLWAAQAWLRRIRPDSTALYGMSDAPERAATMPVAATNEDSGRRAFRWAGAGDPRTGVVRPEDLRTGDLVIAPAEYGGCDEFGWAPNSDVSVEDVADRAARPYWGRRCAIRIARDIVQTDAQWDRVSAVLADESLADSELVERLLDALPLAEALETSEEESDRPLPRDARKPLEALQHPRGRIDVHFPYAGRREEGAVVVAERGVEDARASDDAAPATTEDDNLSHTSAEPVSLEQHSHNVECFARQFARTLGLAKYADDLGLAAFLHDIGKADPRFQTMLSGGDPWNRPDGQALAKSGRRWSPSAWERAGLPKGWRHEALSVRMAREHPRFADAHDPALVLWLIGSHHGLGRPFFGFLDPAPEQVPFPCLDVDHWRLAAEEPGPQSLAFALDGADWFSMFEELKRRHGIWGLAHMEAILRLADHRASDEERAP